MSRAEYYEEISSLFKVEIQERGGKIQKKRRT